MFEDPQSTTSTEILEVWACLSFTHTWTQRKAQTHARLMLGLSVTCQPQLLPSISRRALQSAAAWQSEAEIPPSFSF